MDIKHTDDGDKGLFYINVDGQKQAEMTYTYSDKNTIDINHTEVNNALQGQSIGTQLIAEAVSFMRKNQLKVVPTCSYAKAVFEKNKDAYKNVIK